MLLGSNHAAMILGARHLFDIFLQGRVWRFGARSSFGARIVYFRFLTEPHVVQQSQTILWVSRVTDAQI